MVKTKEDHEKKNQSKKKSCRVPSSSSSSWSEREGVRMRRGVWSEEEDKILVDYITNNGHGTWRNLPKLTGLNRCGKSCRLRWTNYLRPGIKRGPFTPDEEDTIVRLQRDLGNKWAAIASQLPGRTDNDVKNFWNSHLRKRFENKAIIEHPSSPSKTDGTTMIDDSSSPSTHRTIDSYELEPQLHISDQQQQPWNLVPASEANNRPAENDYFMRLWNSEVGESFRNINGSPESRRCDKSVSRSIDSGEACKVITTSPSPPDQKGNCKKEVGDSDSSKSYEMEDSMVKLLLLDFPVDGNDMGFLQGPRVD